MSDQVRVGVAVIIRRGDGRILIGQRKGSHGAGTWALPGGHLDFGETIFHCAAREVEEECGLRIKNLTKGPYVENLFDEVNKHYITIFVRALVDGVPEAVLKEPEKCAEWKWVRGNEVPDPVFPPLENFLRLHDL